MPANPLTLQVGARKCQFAGFVNVPLFTAPYQTHADFTGANFGFMNNSFWPFAITNCREYFTASGQASFASTTFASLSATVLTPNQQTLFRSGPNSGGSGNPGNFAVDVFPAFHGGMMAMLLGTDSTHYAAARIRFPLGRNQDQKPVILDPVQLTLANNKGSFNGQNMYPILSGGIPVFGCMTLDNIRNYGLVGCDFLGNRIDQDNWIGAVTGYVFVCNFPDLKFTFKGGNQNFVLARVGNATPNPPTIIDVAQGIDWRLTFAGSPNDAAVNNDMQYLGAQFVTLNTLGYIVNTRQGAYGGAPTGNVYVISKDGTKFWILNFLAQNALAAAYFANSVGNQAIQVAIDPQGVVYVVPTNAPGVRPNFFTSFGINLDFGVTVPYFPPISLPCWPGCFPTYTKQGF